MSRRRRAARPLSAEPLWYKDAVIYQVHVKSFFDSNNDGIGDLPGLTAKLDYIAELGATAIWLLPFYPSPRRDDGYDISDYRAVHPEYGTIQDMRRFIAAAHARGLRVITELVVNHTSDQHPWFQRARRAKPGSAWRRFYVWADNDRGYADARIIFTDTEKSNWSFDPEAGAYFWHRFYSHQPDLNFDNPRVLVAVLGAMRFWLDLGVDGFRLDAVPYLVEREGTDCENLPETHAIIKRIRAALDRTAPGCMLLAEANQWPEDVQEYFGAGDECHMAFHFPLMPRMYMAIAQEDRFPITDILRQTPEIPDACQWAIFLRNHDELTLEMVTDAERDYLWETYAADRRARLNLGIRRRLAPLLERDPRLIELMNGLLLSMPGTPVIYYGDEIGMGDNIYLGDRDGVRTPMQWSLDRNGGFSRAEPARLVLPPIMDAIYGYQAVNVEAQARDPHSLLNWTRRMLAVRQRHRAFGRGRIRLLYPGNRKILAFLREFEAEGGEETVLCVSNLSRTAQAVELDLAQFAGRTPVDLLSGSVFPPIERAQLSADAAATCLLLVQPGEGYGDARVARAALRAAARTCDAGDAQRDRRAAGARAKARHRAGDSRPLSRAAALVCGEGPQDSARSASRAPMSSAGAPGTFLLFEIGVATEGRQDRYFLPAGIVWEDEKPPAIVQQLALARVRRHRRMGFLTDAFAVDALPAAVLASLAAGRVEPLPDGELRWLATSQEIPTAPPGTEIRRLSAEQSNTSLILGDIAVIEDHPAGPSRAPSADRNDPVSHRARLCQQPGAVRRDGARGCRRHAPDALDRRAVRAQPGRCLAVDARQGPARRPCARRSPGPTTRRGGRRLPPTSAFARVIGKRLAEMHAVLASPTDDPAFMPERVEAGETKAWATAAGEEVDRALQTLENFTAWQDDAEHEVAKELVALRRPLGAKIRELAEAGVGTLRTRLHGDFHLGQILVAGDDAILIDFEGEPSKSLAQRRGKGSPLRDVAGLLRSFDYAAATIAREPAPAGLPTADRRDELLGHFVAVASASFLEGYRTAAAAAEHKWVPDLRSAKALIELFLIEKAAYEIGYEAGNRPAWIGIPLRGLTMLAKRLLTRRREKVDA